MDEKSKNDQRGGATVYELAGLVNRMAASVIDICLQALLLAVIAHIFLQAGRAIPAQLSQFIFFAAPVAYHGYFWTRRDGQTPGKFIFGIKVIKVDGSCISHTDAVIRAIGYNVSFMLFGVGLLWAFVDKNSQTWHDKLARTYVVRNDSQRKLIEISK